MTRMFLCACVLSDEVLVENYSISVNITPMNVPAFWRLSVITLVVIFSCLGGAAQAGLTDIETAILKGDYAQAEKSAKGLLSRDPQKNIAQQGQYYLGLSQLRQGRYKEARSAFLKIKKNNMDPQLRDKVYLGISDAAYLEEDYKHAQDVLDELLGQNPKPEGLSLVYLKLAKVNLKLAQWTQAQDYLTKIVQSFPNSLEAPAAKQLLEEKQYFTVQVGAFVERDRAEQLVMELKQKEEYSYILETTDAQNRKFYRVRIGQLAMLKEAQKVKNRLDKLGYPAKIYP